MNLLPPPNITVIDSVMGSGKSTWAIKHINTNPDKSFLVVLPTLAEVDRYRTGIIREIFVPNDTDTEYDTEEITGDSVQWNLQDKLKLAVMDNKTIITTHRMLEVLDSDSIELIRRRNYELILDEVTNTVAPISLSQADYQVLIEAGLIIEEEERPGVMKVLPTEKDYCDYRNDKQVEKLLFGHFMVMVKLGNVRRVKEQFLVWVASPDKLCAFDHVFILTYMFQGSPMEAWMFHQDIFFEMKSIVNGELTHYHHQGGSPFKHLIRICDNPKWNAVGNHKTALSSSWMSRELDKKKELKDNTRQFFRSIDATCDEVVWATFRKVSKELAPKGYSVRQEGHKIGKKFDPKEIAKHCLDKRSQYYCCIPLNCKGTNAYIHVRAMAVLANYFSFPAQRHFYSDLDLPLDEDQYALSELVQLIWRSRIRDSRPGADRTIDVFIPSKRMRNLLEKWLET